MSRPCSILVERKDPDYQQLKKLYKQTRDLPQAIRILSIMMMIKLQNAEQVADLVEMDADTIRTWVKEFNESGLDSLQKKNDPIGNESFHRKKNSK
jgi:hypothetical protein